MVTSVSRSHGSLETDADRMLDRRAATSAAVLVLRGWLTTGQTDRQTDTRQMHYAYRNICGQHNKTVVYALPTYIRSVRAYAYAKIEYVKIRAYF